MTFISTSGTPKFKFKGHDNKIQLLVEIQDNEANMYSVLLSKYRYCLHDQKHSQCYFWSQFKNGQQKNRQLGNLIVSASYQCHFRIEALKTEEGIQFKNKQGSR